MTTYNELISECIHKILNKSTIIVIVGIAIDWHQVIVDEIVTSQRNHITSFLEKLVRLILTNFSPHQILCTLKQLYLLVQAKSLYLFIVQKSPTLNETWQDIYSREKYMQKYVVIRMKKDPVSFKIPPPPEA